MCCLVCIVCVVYCCLTVLWFVRCVLVAFGDCFCSLLRVCCSLVFVCDCCLLMVDCCLLLLLLIDSCVGCLVIVCCLLFCVRGVLLVFVVV